MTINTRWYRQREPIELGCVMCNKFITPHAEFIIGHYACILPYVELENDLRKLAETNEDVRKLIEELDKKFKSIEPKPDDKNG